MIHALLNSAPSREALVSGVFQEPGVLDFQPASNTEQMVADIGPVSWFQRREGVSCQNGSLFPSDLTNSAPCVDTETSSTSRSTR